MDIVVQFVGHDVNNISPRIYILGCLSDFDGLSREWRVVEEVQGSDDHLDQASHQDTVVQ